MLQDTEPEWILRILLQLNERQKMMTMMLLWRVWHIRNEITHDKPMIHVGVSRRFLQSYVESLSLIRQHPTEEIIKGKCVASYSSELVKQKEPDKQVPNLKKWVPPDLTLNVDGSFLISDGSAGAGMILRNHEGQVIFAACRELRHCADHLEAELAACKEGIRLALHWSESSFKLDRTV